MFPFARFRVEDDSMSPNIEPGDYVVVNRWAYRLRGPAAGDIVVARDPESPARFLVKRISHVGLNGMLGLAGDNASRSHDSRSFGPVGRAAIVGKVWLRLRP